MSANPYSEHVRALFAQPRHSGDLQDGMYVDTDDQGVRLRLALLTADGTIRKLRFRAWGCPHVIAAAEAFCANYEGRAVSELLTFAAGELMQSLPVPAQKTARILVLEDAVRSLGQRVGVAGQSNSRD